MAGKAQATTPNLAVIHNKADNPPTCPEGLARAYVHVEAEAAALLETLEAHVAVLGRLGWHEGRVDKIRRGATMAKEAASEGLAELCGVKPATGRRN